MAKVRISESAGQPPGLFPAADQPLQSADSHLTACSLHFLTQGLKNIPLGGLRSSGEGGYNRDDLPLAAERRTPPEKSPGWLQPRPGRTDRNPEENRRLLVLYCIRLQKKRSFL